MKTRLWLALTIQSVIVGMVAAGEIPKEMTDSSDRATFAWLLERSGAEPEVHYKGNKVEWIGFQGESKYTCGLLLDEQGRVVKALILQKKKSKLSAQPIPGWGNARCMTRSLHKYT